MDSPQHHSGSTLARFSQPFPSTIQICASLSPPVSLSAALSSIPLQPLPSFSTPSCSSKSAEFATFDKQFLKRKCVEFFPPPRESCCPRRPFQDNRGTKDSFSSSNSLLIGHTSSVNDAHVPCALRHRDTTASLGRFAVHMPFGPQISSYWTVQNQKLVVDIPT